MCHGKTEIVPDRDGSDPYEVGCSGLGCLWEVGATILACIGLPSWAEVVFAVKRALTSHFSSRSPREEAFSVRLTVAVTSLQT